jgi:hypothetical protein
MVCKARELYERIRKERLGKGGRSKTEALYRREVKIVVKSIVGIASIEQ